jgi:hypothetical protein
MRLWTAEEELIKTQLRKRIGIFACDDAVVISTESALLGNDKHGNPVHAWQNPAPHNEMGNLSRGATTNSWLNTQVFINAFGTIVYERAGRVWHHDWLIKVDPDAVIFPDRLRWHLLPHSGQAVFLVNCNYHGAWKLFGAIEAFTSEAMRRYQQNEQKCRSLPWKGWGEDTYMQKCMYSLGVKGVSDFTLVGDSRCWYAPCSDQSRAAFHPFKDVVSWMSCWGQHQHAAR